jgi:hypothetical protein
MLGINLREQPLSSFAFERTNTRNKTEKEWFARLLLSSKIWN